MAKKQRIKHISGKECLALRKKMGINQTQFWGPLGVTQSGGSRYEKSGRGMPKATAKLVTLVYVQGLTDDQLLSIGIDRE